MRGDTSRRFTISFSEIQFQSKLKLPRIERRCGPAEITAVAGPLTEGFFPARRSSFNPRRARRARRTSYLSKAASLSLCFNPRRARRARRTQIEEVNEKMTLGFNPRRARRARRTAAIAFARVHGIVSIHAARDARGEPPNPLVRPCLITRFNPRRARRAR